MSLSPLGRQVPGPQRQPQVVAGARRPEQRAPEDRFEPGEALAGAGHADAQLGGGRTQPALAAQPGAQRLLGPEDGGQLLIGPVPHGGAAQDLVETPRHAPPTGSGGGVRGGLGGAGRGGGGPDAQRQVEGGLVGEPVQVEAEQFADEPQPGGQGIAVDLEVVGRVRRERQPGGGRGRQLLGRGVLRTARHMGQERGQQIVRPLPPGRSDDQRGVRRDPEPGVPGRQFAGDGQGVEGLAVAGRGVGQRHGLADAHGAVADPVGDGLVGRGRARLRVLRQPRGHHQDEVAGVDGAPHDPGPAAVRVRADPGHLVAAVARALHDTHPYRIGQPGAQRSGDLLGDGELARHQQVQHRLPAPGLREVHPAASALQGLGPPAHGQRQDHVGQQRGEPGGHGPGGDDGEHGGGAVVGAQGKQQGGVRAGVEGVRLGPALRVSARDLGDEHRDIGDHRPRRTDRRLQHRPVRPDDPGPAVGPPRQPAQQLGRSARAGQPVHQQKVVRTLPCSHLFPRSRPRAQP